MLLDDPRLKQVETSNGLVPDKVWLSITNGVLDIEQPLFSDSKLKKSLDNPLMTTNGTFPKIYVDDTAKDQLLTANMYFDNGVPANNSPFLVETGDTTVPSGELLPEVYKLQPALGQLPSRDERIRLPKYEMSAPRLKERTFRNWLSPEWNDWPAVLDQGSTSECVAYSATKLLLTHPIVNRPRSSTTELYKAAQEIDEWAGSDYDGTSVNAGMKILRNQGLISDWSWAFDPNMVALHVLNVGPVVLGTEWTMEMFKPDASGYIWPEGLAVGGHAYLIIGINTIRENPDGTLGAVRILNSWGANWGDYKGRAWMSLGTLEKLMNGLDGRWRGEAAAVNELSLPR